jgi:hypothetical protein
MTPEAPRHVLTGVNDFDSLKRLVEKQRQAQDRASKKSESSSNGSLIDSAGNVENENDFEMRNNNIKPSLLLPPEKKRKKTWDSLNQDEPRRVLRSSVSRGN